MENLSILKIAFHISPVTYAAHFEDHCYTASLWTRYSGQYPEMSHMEITVKVICC